MTNTVESISKELNLTPNIIYYRIKMLGIKKSKYKFNIKNKDIELIKNFVYHKNQNFKSIEQSENEYNVIWTYLNTNNNTANRIAELLEMSTTKVSYIIDKYIKEQTITFQSKINYL